MSNDYIESDWNRELRYSGGIQCFVPPHNEPQGHASWRQRLERLSRVNGTMKLWKRWKQLQSCAQPDNQIRGDLVGQGHLAILL